MKKIIVILVGILFVGVGIYILCSGDAKAKRCTKEIVGTVVDIKTEWTTDSDGNHTNKYYPIIRYQAEGKTITKQSSYGYSENTKVSLGGGFSVSAGNLKYNLNDNINILYNPDNVEEFIIEGESNNDKIMGIIFIAMGALVVVLGIVRPVY